MGWGLTEKNVFSIFVALCFVFVFYILCSFYYFILYIFFIFVDFFRTCWENCGTVLPQKVLRQL